MSFIPFSLAPRNARAVCLAAACSAALAAAAPCSPAHAATTIEERRPASPQGVVEISNIAGSIDVEGWDRPEVEVSGTVGKDVERVEVKADGRRTSIEVVVPSHVHMGFGREGEAQLVIRVPAQSSVSATLVSADFKVKGLAGDLKLHTVSGDAGGDVGGDVHASAVSGNVRITAATAKSIEIKTISGDITLTGGDADTEVTTISGGAKMTLGTLSRGRFKTVSGTLSARLKLSPEAQIQGESVSGDIKLDFAGTPAAEFDIQTFSGDIENCFGPKPAESRHSHGSSLTFTNGDSHADVRISTQSGSIRLCDKS